LEIKAHVSLRTMLRRALHPILGNVSVHFRIRRVLMGRLRGVVWPHILYARPLPKLLHNVAIDFDPMDTCTFKVS
jgi:hypothetical protein